MAPITPAALAALCRGDIANAIIASTPGGIEQQEADGQRELVESTMLPKEIDGATREQLTELGFTFGADVDDLFVQCELPAGWTKQGTEHSMHSDLFDDQGRKRAGIFYKAAFYDRRASMHMLRRFNIGFREGSQDDYRRYVVTDENLEVEDGGEVDTVVFDAGEYDRTDYKQGDKLRDDCIAWLNERYPDCRNPLAYW